MHFYWIYKTKVFSQLYFLSRVILKLYSRKCSDERLQINWLNDVHSILQANQGVNKIDWNLWEQKQIKKLSLYWHSGKFSCVSNLNNIFRKFNNTISHQPRVSYLGWHHFVICIYHTSQKEHCRHQQTTYKTLKFKSYKMYNFKLYFCYEIMFFPIQHIVTS